MDFIYNILLEDTIFHTSAFAISAVLWFHIVGYFDAISYCVMVVIKFQNTVLILVNCEHLMSYFN
jgi:hypothetical protein